MPATFIRSSSCAIVLALGILAPAGLHAAESPAKRTVVTPQPVTTGQGSSVSVSNVNVPANAPVFLIVGAESANSNAGSATIYGRVDNKFKKSKTLSESTNPCTEFGKSVSMPLKGDLALVGAPLYGTLNCDSFSGEGSAFLYQYRDSTWQKMTALTGTGAIGTAHQGDAVFISPDGSTAFVGGPADNGNKGAVWVYDLRSGTPVQQAKLVPNDAAGDYVSFGVSISSDKLGNRVAIGGESDNGVGAVWVFQKKGGTWKQAGAKIRGTEQYGSFGTKVAMTWNGTTLVASAPGTNSNKGTVYVYQRSPNGKWKKTNTLTDSNPPSDYAVLGNALAIQPENASTIVASEPYTVVNDPTRGRLLTYTQASPGAPYVLTGMTLASSCSELGHSLAMSQSADLLFAGSPGTTTNAGETGGTCAYMRMSGDTGPWMQVGTPIVTK